MSRLGRHELITLVLLALITAGIWIFAELADEVIEGDTKSFDETVLLAMRTPGDSADPVGPRWLHELGRDFTALGGVGFLTLLTLAVIGFLVLQRRYGAAVLVAVSIGGGFLVSSLLKYGFERPRPDLISHESYVYTTSFPSGHSMLSAVTYLTLGALLARIQPQLRLKAYIMLLAILLTLLVGISRVYLGVHWPTDVLAGWAVGSSWALLCWLIARWMQQSGRMKTDDEPSDQPPNSSS